MRPLYRGRLPLLLPTVLLCLFPLGTSGQTPFPQNRASVLEVETRARWLHGLQNPRFTSPVLATTRLFLDTIAREPDAGTRTGTFHLDRTGSSDKMTVRWNRSGHVVHAEASLLPRPARPHRTPADSARAERYRFFLPGGTGQGILSLPETRGWLLAPTLPVGDLAGRESWADTFALEASRGGFRQALAGQRRTRVTGDTIIDGRRLWVLSDSADIRISEMWITEERTLKADVTVEREGVGTLLGEGIFDPTTGLYRVRRDSMVVHGTSILRYPDGRAFSTPATFERSRTSEWLDESAFAERQEARRRDRASRGGGTVRFPVTDLERRLSQGDSILRDSLMAQALAATDPLEAQELFSLTIGWGPSGGDFRSRLYRLRFAAGDTAWWAGQMARRVWRTPQGLDLETLSFLTPFLLDPGQAWAFGLNRDPPYENLLGHLLHRPPAVTPDTSLWPCTPDACSSLAQAWPHAGEPRLRGLGLVARFVMDPSTWADTLRMVVRSDSTFLPPALDLVDGVGATWVASSGRPLPVRGASWRAWWEWADGRSPGAPSSFPSRAYGPRFEESHATAIRMHMAMTGRPLVQELHERAGDAEADSARLVFRSILSGLGELKLEPEEAARLFRSGIPTDVTLGIRILPRLFGRASPAEALVVSEVLDRLLAFELEGGPLWPRIPRSGGGPEAMDDFGPHTTPGLPTYVSRANLPESLLDRWRGRAEFVSGEAWSEGPEGTGGLLLTLGPVLRSGPFLKVRFGGNGRQARDGGQTPFGWAFWGVLYLLESEEGWVIVGTELAMT